MFDGEAEESGVNATGDFGGFETGDIADVEGDEG